MTAKPKRWECILRRPEIRKEVNPRLQKAWRAVIDGSSDPPYAALQRTWRQVHCSTVNPYGSETCGYEPRDCVLAYWKTAMDAIEEPTVRSVIGYFRFLAQKRGYERAENKPLARDKVRTDDQTEGGDPGAVAGDPGQGQGVHRTRPTAIGSLLGSDYRGPSVAPTGRRQRETGTR